MKRGNPKGNFTVLALALVWGMASDAGAADPSTTRSAPPPSGTSRAAPASPAAPATGPASTTRPAQPGKPDYAIALGSQQEFKNTAMAWTFRIDNRGNAAPVAPTVTKNMPYGASISSKGDPARLVISVGQPCPETKSWKPLSSIPVPVVQPGASVVVPQTLYKMPDEYAGKGCRFRAELEGPAGDANAGNNVMHMITKTAMMPDLQVVFGPDMGGPGGNIDVKNVGNAPAGPSTFHWECQTKDPNLRCGQISDKWQPNVVFDVPVPALKPGQSHVVKKSTPKGPGVTWKAYADYAHQVQEGNEDNNVLTGGK